MMLLRRRHRVKLVLVVFALTTLGIGGYAAFKVGSSALSHSIGVTIPPASFFTTPATESVWWIGAESKDSSVATNEGVQTTIQVIDFQTAGCLAFWDAESLTNSVWGQVGYFICTGD